MGLNNRCATVCVWLAVLLCANRASASSVTVGSDGINSKVLGLTGQSVAIGMVEGSRPGKNGYDTDPNNHHDQITPAQVYNGTIISVPNDSTVGPHATQVAGVMIATATPDASVEGVASEAQLHAAGIAFGGGTNHDDAASALNGVAKRASNNVRAINMSFGFHDGNPDGRSTITQFVDWSASHQDVLYVAAYDDAEFLPGDNFNGITVGSSRRFNGTTTGRYREVDPDHTFFNDADGSRTSIDLLAPGVEVKVASLNNQTLVNTGTSFAAPHVVGTVALLQQYSAADYPQQSAIYRQLTSTPSDEGCPFEFSG